MSDADTENNKNRSEDRPWIRADLRVFDKTSVIIILLGLVLFALGLGVDLGTPKYPEIADVFDNCADSSSPQCAEALREFDRQSHVASELTVSSFFAGFLQAVGLTIVAAVFISSTVDRRTRSYFFKELARKTEMLGNNILMGMFESRHNANLFPLVKDEIFEKKILRKNIDLNYTLTDLDDDFSEGRLKGMDFVKVDVIISTVNENINVSGSPGNGKVGSKVGIGLPNPMLDELKRHVTINGFRIGDRVLEREEIDSLNDELQEKLKDDLEPDASIEIGEFELEAGQSITVSGSYTMIKDAQDSEVFRSVELAENIHLTVVDKTSHNLRVRARALAHGRLHGQESPSAKQWKLDELSLPLQGIMVWWKKAPPGPSPLAQEAQVDPKSKVPIG